MDTRETEHLPGVVVVGGAMVNSRNNRWYIQSRFLNYLIELESLVGEIYFFASRYVEESPSLFPSLLPTSINVHPVVLAPSSIGKLTTSGQLLWAYGKALRSAEFVIHFFPAAMDPITQLLLRSQSKSYLTYYKSDWIEWTKSQAGRSRWKIGYWQALEMLECQLADASLFRSQLHKKRILSQCRGTVGMSQPILSVSSDKPERVRPDGESESLQLLFVGVLAPEKGLRELLNSLGEIAMEGGKGFILHLVGAPHRNAGSDNPGTLVAPPWLASAIAGSGLEDRVILHGFVDDSDTLGQLYANADVFVLPSWSEGFPRVLDEAMSYSLPIITTEVGGIGEILTNGKDAVLVKAKDVKSLTDGLRLLVEDVELRGFLGAAGHRNFTDRVDQSAAVQHANYLFENRKP